MKFPVKVIIRGYTGRGAGAAFVKILPYRRIAHVSLVFYFSDGSSWEYESIQGKGVVNHPPTTGKKFEAYAPDLSPAQIALALEVAKGITGKYDNRAIFGFFLRFVKPSAERWICSEFVAYIMAKARKRLSKREPFQETPTFVCDSNDAGPRDPAYEELNAA